MLYTTNTTMLKWIIGSFAMLLALIWFGSAQTVISDCSDWVAMNDNLEWSYVLSGDINCIYTGNNVMIGSNFPTFQGSVNWNGYTISYAISGTDENMWLFRVLQWATIENLGLSGSVVSTNGQIWWLAGYIQNESTIENIFGTVYVSWEYYVGWLAGTTAASSQSFSGIDLQGTVVGGWLGWNSRVWWILGGSSQIISIDNSSFSGNVSADGDYVWWLLWWGFTGYINNSAFVWSIQGSEQIGGIAGIIYVWSITQSSADVTIDGLNTVWWLIGNTLWVSITDSYAIVNLSISDPTYGFLWWLVGSLDGSILRSYAIGILSGSQYVWWLVGWAFNSTISQSYADIDIYSTADVVWWLIGYIQDSDVYDSYALGNISANWGNNVGGAIGIFNEWNFSNLYAIGSIDGDGYNYGWLMGLDASGTGINSFWDTEASGLTSSDAGSGLDTANMQSFFTYDSVGWDIILTNDVGPQNYPYLIWQVNSDLSGSNRILSDNTEPVITYTWWDVVNGGTVEPGAIRLEVSVFDTHLSGWHIHIVVGTSALVGDPWPTDVLWHGWTTPYDSTSIAWLSPTLDEGTYYWYATAEDIAGNSVKWTVQMFTVTNPPVTPSGGRWWWPSPDHCPDGDNSGSYYDGSCGDENMAPAEKVVQRLVKKWTKHDEQRIQSTITIISLLNDEVQMRDDVSDTLKELLNAVIESLKEYYDYNM